MEESCELPPELNPNLNVATIHYTNQIQVEKIVMYEVYIGSQADPLARDWKWPAVWGDNISRKLGYFPAGEPFDQELTIHGNGENVDILYGMLQIS